MHGLRASLNKLLKKTLNGFQRWNAGKNKRMRTPDLFFTHYDLKKIIVTSDASSYGIGACIMHKLKDS